MTEPPAVDRAAGMEAYASATPPCWARIKSSPEDFVVEEALGIRLHQEPGDGSYPVYKVEKRLIDTFHLERELAKRLGSKVKFAGLKDKRAVAVQYATPMGRRNAPSLVEAENFRAELVGYSSKPIGGTDITGNRFKIVLRECCPAFGERVREIYDLADAERVPNFFGLQRFGAGGALTHRLGAAMVKRDFERVVEILLTEPRMNDTSDAAEARAQFSKGNYDLGARLLGRGSDTERLVASRLAGAPGDFLRALRAIPIRLRRFFPQAYQSYIFNRALSRALIRGLDISTVEPGDNWGDLNHDGLGVKRVHGVKEPHTMGAVPLFQLVGFAYRDYRSRFDACTREVLAEEGVVARQFYVQEMQEVSPEGGFRRPSMAAKEMSLGQGDGQATLWFTLARGEYATVFVREMVKPTDPIAQGFA